MNLFPAKLHPLLCTARLLRHARPALLASTALILSLPQAAMAQQVIETDETVTTSSSDYEGGDLFIGDSNRGKLTIQDGGMVRNEGGYIGYQAGSEGTVIVTGTDSTWRNGENLTVGDSGEGTLTISEGGLVSNDNGYIGFNPESTGIVTVTGEYSTWTNNDDLTVGDSGNGTLTISDGGLVSNTIGHIGYAADSIGIVTVTGEGSTWTNNDNLFVGNSGSGTLTIELGGYVSDEFGVIGDQLGGTGDVTVTGDGSSWMNNRQLYIGNYGDGTLTIADGGLVENTHGLIGKEADGTGSVTVTGEGSIWTNNGDLYVGNYGDGTLTIADGGSVSNEDGYIADEADSIGSVTVTGQDSSWTSSGEMAVGAYGNGTLTISDGGAVSNAGAAIAYGQDSSGTVTVTGEGSIWTSTGDLAVGYYGDAELTITDGGTVAAEATASNSPDGIVYLAAYQGSTGVLNIGAAADEAAAAAGRLESASLVFGYGAGTLVFNHTEPEYDFSTAISGSGTIAHLAGETELSGNSSAFTGTTSISGGTLLVTGSLGGTINTLTGGTLTGTGTVGTSGSTVTIGDGGTLTPGLSGSTGSLTVAGNLSFENGSTYVVQTSGASGNSIVLSGGDVSIASGSTLLITGTATAYSYTILTSESLSGAFTTIDWGTLEGYEVSYDYANGVITLVQTFLTPNQSSVASVVQSGGAPAALQSVIGTLGKEQEVKALQQLSGQSHADMNTGLIKINLAVNNTVNARIRAVTGGVAASSVPVLGYGEEKKTVTDDRFAAFEKKEVPADPDRFAVWANGFGSWGQTDGSNGGSSTDMASAGMLAGGDAIITGNLRAGFFGGFSRSYFDDSNSKGDSSNYHAGAYAGTSWDALSFRTGLSYTWYDVGTKRSISALNETVEGKYDASSLNAFGEVSYRIETAHAAFEPFAGLSHTHMETDGFTETGGLSALTVNGQTTDTTYTTLGMRASTDVNLGLVTASLRGSLGWLYAFGEIDSTRTARFATGNSFNVTGTPLDRNAALVETGMDFALTPASTLGITYSGQFSNNAQEHGANARLRVQF